VVTILGQNGAVLAKVVETSDWMDGLSFHSDPQDYIQVGTWHIRRVTSYINTFTTRSRGPRPAPRK